MTTRDLSLPTEADLIAEFVAVVRNNYDLPEQVIDLIAAQPGLDEALQVAFAAGVAPTDINAFATGLAGVDFQRPRAERPQPPAGRGAEASATLRDFAIARSQPRQIVENPQTGEQGTVDPVQGTFQSLLSSAPGSLAAEEEAAEDFAGGFPTSYRPLVDRFATARVGGPFRGRGRTVTTQGPSPLYYEWDSWRQFAGKSPEYIDEVKQQFIEAGIIDEDQAGPRGLWRREDAEVMYALMTEANAGGRTWVEVLAQYKLDPEPGERARSWRAANPFIAPVFRAPDYATLSTAVRTAFEQQVGRTPKDYELALLADQMRADFNAAHAADVSAARQQYEAAARGVETESAQSAGSVQEVDPMARLEEAVLRLYGPEIERVEGVEENQLNVGLMMRNLTGIERAVG